MARKNHILDTLLDKGEVIWSPHGNSMTPKIHSGDEVKIIKITDPSILRVGDIVYVKVKSNFYLHLLSAINESKQRYQISNNHGFINGWVAADKIYGICVSVQGKILLTEDLQKRAENK